MCGYNRLHAGYVWKKRINACFKIMSVDDGASRLINNGRVNMAEISSAPVKRLLVESSGGMRVAGSAVDRAIAEAEAFLRSLGQVAGQCAAADQRKTVQDSDIAQALTSLRQGGQPQA
jgi:histone H3/H4